MAYSIEVYNSLNKIKLKAMGNQQQQLSSKEYYQLHHKFRETTIGKITDDVNHIKIRRGKRIRN